MITALRLAAYGCQLPVRVEWAVIPDDPSGLIEILSVRIGATEADLSRMTAAEEDEILAGIRAALAETEP